MEGPTFGVLRSRLLEHVRLLLKNKELTERGLARMIGMSQPHVHNVLKGVRSLTPEVADLIMGRLGLSAIEMARAAELGECLERLRPSDGEVRDVPVLKGSLGPSAPFPNLTDALVWTRMPGNGMESMRRPVLVPFVPDAEHPWSGAEMALLDVDEAWRARPSLPGWYALRWGGRGYIRQVVREGPRLRVLGQRTMPAFKGPEYIPVDRLGVLSVVRARVAWVGPDLRYTGVLRQIGLFLDMPAST